MDNMVAKISCLVFCSGELKGKQDIFATMLSILRKARLKDKEMRILMLYGL
jgi:hypothetical protein